MKKHDTTGNVQTSSVTHRRSDNLTKVYESGVYVCVCVCVCVRVRVCVYVCVVGLGRACRAEIKPQAEQ